MKPSWSCQPSSVGRTATASDDVKAKHANHCTRRRRKECEAGRRVMEALIEMRRQGAAINFNTIGTAARVSKTFLYHPKHSDLAQQIRSLSQLAPQSTATKLTRSIKSNSAKDAQIARFEERVRALEEQVRSLEEENELFYGKLSERALSWDTGVPRCGLNRHRSSRKAHLFNIVGPQPQPRGTRSLASQGHNRIDSRRPPCGNVTRH